MSEIPRRHFLLLHYSAAVYSLAKPLSTRIPKPGSIPGAIWRGNWFLYSQVAVAGSYSGHYPLGKHWLNESASLGVVAIDSKLEMFVFLELYTVDKIFPP